MASPFTIFRKYGKSLMAILVVMLMVGWGVLGVLQNMQDSRSARAQDPLVVTSAHGDLTENTLLNLRQQKNMVRMFLGRVMLLKAQPQFAFFVERQLNQLLGGFSDEALVEDWFLTKESERRGLIVPDVAVDRFLEGVTGGQVRAEEYKQVLLEVQQASPLRPNKATLYNGLRNVIAANQMRVMSSGMLLSTPAERFEGYQRLRRRAQVELIPIDTKGYLDKVTEPSEAKLKELYEKHKKEEPTPGSPDPGFKVPAKSSFMYVKAEYEKFVKPDAVTADEIQAYYDKNKDERYTYRGLETNPEPEAPAKPADAPKPDDKKPADTPKPTPPASTEKPAEKKPDAPKPDDKKPADAPKPTPPASTEKPAEKKTDEKKPDEKKSDAPKPTDSPKPDDKKPADAPKPTPPASTEKPAEKKPDEKKPAEKKPDEKKSSAILPAAELETLVAYADDAAKAADAVKAAADKATPATKSDATDKAAEKEPAKTPATPAITPPTNAVPTTQPPAAPAKPEAPPQLVEKFKLPESVRDGPNPKYEPFHKVEKEIRDQLAREAAAKKIDELMVTIDNKLSEYSQQLFTWEAEQRGASDEKKKTLKEPTAPDLAAIAKTAADKAGFPDALTAGNTGMITIHEAARIPGLGESTTQDGRPFAAYACRPSMRVFTMTKTTDTAGNRYNVIKVSTKEAFMPTFAEAKTDVLNAWKTIEARKFVKEEAEKLVAEARKANKPLKEVLPKDSKLTVLEPEAFSWLSRNTADPFGQRGAPPQLTEVEGVLDGGDEFMRGVFALETDGSVGVTMNNPKTIAYVVRIKSYSPSAQLLRDTFLVDPPFESMSALSGDQRQMFQTWLADRRKLAKLDWKREPGREEEF